MYKSQKIIRKVAKLMVDAGRNKKHSMFLALAVEATDLQNTVYILQNHSIAIAACRNAFESNVSPLIG